MSRFLPTGPLHVLASGFRKVPRIALMIAELLVLLRQGTNKLDLSECGNMVLKENDHFSKSAFFRDILTYLAEF